MMPTNPPSCPLPSVVSPLVSPSPCLPVPASFILHGNHRQGEHEIRSLPYQTLHPDATLMSLDNVAGNGQAEARAGVILSRAAGALVEALEDLFEILFRNPRDRYRKRSP